MPGNRTLRAAGTVAAQSLRVYWTSAVAAVVLGLAGLSVQIPIRSLGQPAHQSVPLLWLPAVAASLSGIEPTAASREPAALQSQALQQLYELLLILGWSALIIAGISMLTRFAAQAAARGPEIGVRRAAGASRPDLVLALLGEGAVVLLVILTLGLPASALILGRATATWPGMVTGAGLLPWGALLLVAIVVTLGVLAPFRYSGSRYMRSQADGQVTLGIPTFQLAISLTILMASAALLQRTPATPPSPAGASHAPRVLMALETGTSSEEERARSIAELLERMAQEPGVAGVSLASPGTLLGLGRVDDVTTDCGSCFRGGIQLGFDLHTVTHFIVSLSTFFEQGIHVLSGRGFDAADNWGSDPVAVVSRHLAVSGYQASGPVGRNLFLGNDWPNRPYRVIGVVDDPMPAALGGALEPLDTVYLSVLQHPPRAAELLVRTQGAGMSDSSVAAVVQSQVGPQWNAQLIGQPEAVFASAAQPVRWFGPWYIAVGLVVLLAALAGTFGTMRMWVESCTAEIAARRSVGATRLRIIGWVLWQTAGTGLKGVLIGLFVYFSVLRVSLTNLIGPLPVWDPSLFAVLAGLLLGAAVLGAVIPTVGLLRRPIASLFG